MYKKSSSTKEKIMLITAKQLNEKEADQISIADIAKEAGVAVGLINYHFQTKENLFSAATEFFILQKISQESKNVVSSGLKAEKRLLASLKGYGDFLAEYSRMCRLYFMNAFGKANSDISQMGYEHYIPILRELYPNKTDADLVFIIYPIVCAVQMMFLDNAPFKAATGLDFFCKKYRCKIIEKMVSDCLRRENK